MTSAALQPRGWTARRWWSAIALVTIVQVAMVFWLEDRSVPRPRKPEPAPVFQLGADRLGEWLTIEDPTLFALPHYQGFSGEAWLKTAPEPIQLAEAPSEPPQLLAPDIRSLGASLSRFVETNASPAFPAIAVPQPEMVVLDYLPIAPPPVPSRLELGGDLANRRLLAPLQLPSWTNSDLLTNSIVQLLVDSQGLPVSAALLARGTGLQADADLLALTLAKTARFEPEEPDSAAFAAGSPAGLAIGILVFEWQTIPGASTNAPSATP